MAFEVFGAGITILLLFLPLLVQMYVQRLPVAPLCPDCRAVTREVPGALTVVRLLPLLAATFRGECGRCGWRGRMRWKWAPRAVRRKDR